MKRGQITQETSEWSSCDKSQFAVDPATEAFPLEASWRHWACRGQARPRQAVCVCGLEPSHLALKNKLNSLLGLRALGSTKHIAYIVISWPYENPLFVPILYLGSNEDERWPQCHSAFHLWSLVLDLLLPPYPILSLWPWLYSHYVPSNLGGKLDNSLLLAHRMNDSLFGRWPNNWSVPYFWSHLSHPDLRAHGVHEDKI